MPSPQRVLRQGWAAPKELLFYWRIAPVTRAETKRLIEHFDLGLGNRHVTDLGPAIGTSMAVFRDLGARCAFVERHPLFYAACRQRGFPGTLGDFLRRPELIEKTFDIVYLRGSVGPSSFDSSDDLRAWVAQLRERANWLFLCPWLGVPAPEWFTPTLDEELERHQILGVSTPIYPYTWVSGSASI